MRGPHFGLLCAALTLALLGGCSGDEAGSDAGAGAADAVAGADADAVADAVADAGADADAGAGADADADAVAVDDGSLADCGSGCDVLAPGGDAAGDTGGDGTGPDTSSDTAGTCTTSADCPQPATGCLGNVCIGGTCTPQALPDATPCNDGDPCTAKAACAGGSCKAAASVDCDDGAPCTVDTCDPASGGCKHAPAAAGTGCDDGQDCTLGTTCDDAGSCNGGSNSCGCATIADCAAYDDGDPCNGSLYCNTNLAIPACEVLPSSVVICDTSADGVCQQTACDKTTGACLTLPKDDGAACDDGNPCSKGERCIAGGCSALVNTCQCQVAADCAAYDDGNACNGTLFCDTASLPYTCKLNPASIPSCPKPASQCEVAACDPKAGACVTKPRPDGTPCDDGNVQTKGDSCQQGACQPGTSIAQCKENPDCASFEDGDFCNGTLFCNKQTGACELNPATQVACPSVDDTACSKNSCEPKSGLCKPKALPDTTACEDGSPCTVGEVCQQGQCVASANTCECGQDSDCASKEDGNLCNGTLYCDKQSGKCLLDPQTVVGCPTVDDTACSKNSCQPKTGKCSMTASAEGLGCDDGNPCTSGEVCSGGACVGTQTCACQEDADCVSQDDGDLCNGTLYCNKKTGSCETNLATVKVCPSVDDTACSKNVCNPKTGACAMTPTSNGVACDADGNPCTQNDFCSAGVCKPGKVTCECNADADCTGAQGDDKCVVDMFCELQSHSCKPTKTVTCDTSGDTACRHTACDPQDGQCKVKLQPTGTLCGESAICAGAQICDDKGACVAGEASDCDDADACTADACDPVKGCTFTAKDSGACDDGNVCTEQDSCAKGQCVGTSKDCSDESPCTADACDPKLGCVHLPAQATGTATKVLCDDGDLCSIGDFCLQGFCLTGSKVLLCDDGNPCTVDSCDPVQGCVAKAQDGGKCDDGDGCTKTDACTGGACKGVQLSCDDGSGCTVDSCDKDEGCLHAPQVGKVCDDGNACTVGDACISSGLCASGQPKLCDDANPCTVDLCDPLQGCISKEVVGSKCDDGNACTVNEKCDKGLCTGSPRDCDDGLACSKDTCDKDAGCQYAVPEGAKCDDGNACTAGDTCAKTGACVPGPGLSCDDNNGCTTDACDPKSGCTHKALDGIGCDDGDACTQADKCVAGKCKGSGKSCDDGLPCTTDGCDPAGGCTHAVQSGATCSDNDACTIGDSCLQSGYCKPGAQADCDDGNACTQDTCGADKGCQHTIVEGAACSDGTACTVNDACDSKGKCVGSPLSCDDGKACTTDSCDKLGGCKVTPKTDAPCDDGNACTTGDICLSSGVCAPTGSKLCGDGNSCTIDSCDPKSGCVNAVQDKASCDDGSACTSGDACNGSQCVGSPITCDDGQSCTKDSCDKAKGCVHEGLGGASCSDGNACTSGDTCSAAGTCNPGKGVNCDDGKPCTTDSCDAATGCKYVAIDGISCTDGDACTGNDACSGGACKGTTVVCDDDNACTTDSCDKVKGCGYAAKVGTSCNDGNACTTGDVCDSKGKCGGSKATCNDNNVCTLDLCDVDSGCYATKLEGAACDDGKICTVSDACGNGVCAGSPKDCDDGNECTTDACDAQKGCTHTPASKPCNDGDECTTGDTCVGGQCKSVAKNCSDGNDCTIETCHKLLGCQTSFAKVGASCSDNDACTEDACDGFGGCDSTPLLGSRSFPQGYRARDVFVGPSGVAYVVGDSDTAANGAFVARMSWLGKQPPLLYRQQIRGYHKIVPMPDGKGGVAGLYLLGRGALGPSGDPLEPYGEAWIDFLPLDSSKLSKFYVPTGLGNKNIPHFDHFSHGAAMGTQLLVGAARMGFAPGNNGVLLGAADPPNNVKENIFWKPDSILGNDHVKLAGVHLTPEGGRYALVVYGDAVATRMVLLQWVTDKVFEQPVWARGLHADDVDIDAEACHLVGRADGGFDIVLPGKYNTNLGVHVRHYSAKGEFVAADRFQVDEHYVKIARRGEQFVAIDRNLGFHILRRAVAAPQASRVLLTMPEAMAFGPQRDVFFLQHQLVNGLALDTLERRDPWASQTCGGCMTQFALGCGAGECQLDDCNAASGNCTGGASSLPCDDGNPCTIESCTDGKCSSTPANAGTTCSFGTGYCTGSTGSCDGKGVCTGKPATTTCVDNGGSCTLARCIEGNGCVNGPRGPGTVCAKDGNGAPVQWCSGPTGTSCLAVTKILNFGEQKVNYSEKYALKLPAFAAGVEGKLRFMRISLTVSFTGAPYDIPFLAANAFSGINVIAGDGSNGPTRLVDGQNVCTQDNRARTCFPYGLTTATLNIPDEMPYLTGGDAVASLNFQAVPKEGYALQLHALANIVVTDWAVEIGISP
ncbi:MAG: hypothetical protein H6747_01730 [Deltaproteobacteria bacterium]|nr:hypothetical protein [Deltaproteobacteria bacterium]